MTKVGFVGAGKIGANAVYSTLHRVHGLKEIAIVDLQENLAVGEAMDLNTAAAGLGLETRVVGGSDYGLLSGADVVVVSAGLARKPGMTREDLLLKNAGIIKDITGKILAASPKAQINIVTNPVDPLVYAAWKSAGVPRSQIYGMGALHDSMRLWDVLRDNVKAPIWNDSWILGNHGEQMFPAASIANTGGAKVDWNAAKETVRGRAASIIEKKGATYYAPGIAISQMVQAALGQGPKQIVPTVCVLDGEFGQKGVALGVPAVIGKRGIEKIVEYPLTGEDADWMRAAAKSIQDQIAQIG
ncbi:MAG TPA: malate dehydrogenase [Candidatus Thermoplasmatota archaeon]|nr:malate dehydrogenase [Candidatus Thermoplasmatota archaeon]